MSNNKHSKNSQLELKDLTLPECDDLKPVIQVLLFEFAPTSSTSKNNVAQSLLEDVLGLKLISMSHYQDELKWKKYYRCQVEFTCDHLKDWQLLILGETYQPNMKQTVVFQFEVLENQTLGDLSLQQNDYDGCLIVLTPGITVEIFDEIFMEQMGLTPHSIVKNNIHFLNTCPPANYLRSDRDSIGDEEEEGFHAECLPDDVRPFVHSLFPAEIEMDQDGNFRSSVSPNTSSPVLVNRTSYAMHKLYQSDDVIMLMDVFRDVILRLLLEIYKFDKYRVSTEKPGYKECLQRCKFMHSQLGNLLAGDHHFFMPTLNNLNKHFGNHCQCLVKLAKNCEPQFDPLKIWSKLGWEQLEYDVQLALVQLYIKEHVFKLSSQNDSCQSVAAITRSSVGRNTVFLTEQNIKQYYKKKQLKQQDPLLATIVKNSKFGKRGGPTYKAPTYYIDYKNAAVIVEVWIVDFVRDEELSDVRFIHMKYTFPCEGVRMKVTESEKLINNWHTSTVTSSLFACVM